LDHHFVTFSPIPAVPDANILDNEMMHVVELDGTKVLPVDHGSIASILREQQSTGDDEEEDSEEDRKKRSFLRAVACVIRTQYMDVEPDSIEFTMMALCKVK